MGGIGLPTKIKIKRIERGITQWELAKMIGIHPTTMSLFETGKIKPSKETLEKIAKILGCSPEELQD